LVDFPPCGLKKSRGTCRGFFRLASEDQASAAAAFRSITLGFKQLDNPIPLLTLQLDYPTLHRAANAATGFQLLRQGTEIFIG
jgi:hypothetical protein